MSKGKWPFCSSKKKIFLEKNKSSSSGQSRGDNGPSGAAHWGRRGWRIGSGEEENGSYAASVNWRWFLHRHADDAWGGGNKPYSPCEIFSGTTRVSTTAVLCGGNRAIIPFTERTYVYSCANIYCSLVFLLVKEHYIWWQWQWNWGGIKKPRTNSFNGSSKITMMMLVFWQ